MHRWKWPQIPASFFGIVLGLIGLGGGWRAAHELWSLPSAIGEALMLAGSLVWLVLLILFIVKWIVAREAGLSEARHPVQCCFIGLVGVSTMLVAVALQPHAHVAALIVFAAGLLFTVGFALWRTGVLWQGERDQGATTPVLYLPTVAGSFVTAIAAGSLGFADWGRLGFGAGLFSWIAVESVLLHRLYTVTTLPPALRPTLGIQLAPPTVGALAYLNVTSGPPDMVVYALIGYGLLQLFLLVRLLPWILHQPLSPAYWSFSFGLTALATALLRMTLRGDTGPAATLAPVVFVAVTAIIALLTLWTLWLLLAGRILPAAPAPVVPVPNSV